MLLVTGGNGDSGYKLASTEVSLSSSKQKVSVISLLQSQINVLSVVQIRINLNQVAVYSSGGLQWREVAGGDLPSARSALRAAMVGDALHVTGGVDGNSILTSILAWDPDTESWTAAGDLAVPRYLHAAVAITGTIDIKCP